MNISEILLRCSSANSEGDLTSISSNGHKPSLRKCYFTTKTKGNSQLKSTP